MMVPLPSPRAVSFDENGPVFVYPPPPYTPTTASAGADSPVGAPESPGVTREGVDLVDKQRLLLKFLMTFKPENTQKEIKQRMNSCRIVLELLEQEKLFLSHLMKTLNDQKCLADRFSKEENSKAIEQLKYCDSFPVDDKLAYAFMQFFLTELYFVRTEKTRSRVLHSLVRESRYLSSQFVGAPKMEMEGSEGRLFLLLRDVSQWDEATVRSSESIKFNNCSWTLSAQLVKTQKLRFRALSAFKPGSGCHVCLTLYCNPPKVNSLFRFCSSTLTMNFSLLNRHEPGNDIVKTLSVDFEGSKMTHWEVPEFASWDNLKSDLDVWAKNDSFLFECSFTLNEY